MNGTIWGIIGVLLALLGLGIPIAYGIKALLKEIQDALESVKSLLDVVLETVNNVNSTVDKMSAFIDRNERQHHELRTMVDNGFDRLTDNVNNSSNRVMDTLNKR